MTNYAIYDDRGMVTQTVSFEQPLTEEVLRVYSESGVKIKQVDNINKHFYIDKDGGVVDLPERPSKAYELDPETKTWVFNSVSFLNSVRIKRNRLLAETDYTENFSFQAKLTEEKKQLWADYRQALRDITKQSELTNLVWPVLPI